MNLNIKRYLNKKIFKSYFKNKYKIKTLMIKKYESDENFSVRKRNLYYLTFFKYKFPVYIGIAFNTYQDSFYWIKNKFNNLKYYKMIISLKDKNISLNNKVPNRFKKSFKQRTLVLCKFFYLYNYFFNSLFVDIFYFNKFIKIKKKKLLYYLFLSFKKNKFFINLKNFRKNNYTSISTGLFIKFFEKKKSFKKNKTIKLLMAKYIRKIFLISNIKNTILVIKRNPTFLMEIINFFNSPISHKFIDPINNRIVEENDNNFIWIKFLYFIFFENKNFSKNKMPQKGRIKRKILRKVVFENKIID